MTSPVHTELPESRDAEPALLLLRRARKLLDTVATITNERGLTSGGTAFDLRSADDSLRATQRLVVARITRRDPSSDDGGRAELAAVLLQLGDARAALKDAELTRRAASVTDVHAGLRRLRSVDSVAQLTDLVPLAVHRLGFNRVMLSRLRGPCWVARSAFVAGDATLAEAMVRVGQAAPGRVDPGWPESDAVHRRVAILVPDAQRNPRVHPELKALTSTREYVSAPLVAGGKVIGLLHADRSATAAPLTELDRDLLGLFAEGLGFVFERTVCHEQLTALKRRLEEQARSVGELIDGFLDAGALGPAMPAMPASAAGPARPFLLSGPLAELTRRELEVLSHLADGRPTAQIASMLFVSAGTVKTHVKHLLHKLGAANRAEAVARYHQLTR
jgi:DNA-binding CsgD family transcriptional regulator/GAF domain-containing protein